MIQLKLGQTLSRWLTVLAGGIAIGTSGLGSYWGNLFIYFASYIQKHFQVESDLIDPWILPFWLVGVASVIFFAGQLAKVIGKRATLFCGIVLQNFGIIMVYFVIGYSMALINICLGIVHGIGAGCVQITVSQFVLEWGGDRPGFFIALIRGFTVIGAIGINHFVTVYVNPDNLTPDTEIGSQRVFSQDSVVEKVPSIFLVLGGVFFCLQFICLLIVRENPRYAKTKIEDKSTRSCYHSVGSDQTQLVESGSARIVQDSSSLRETTDRFDDVLDVTPRQVIRRKDFYVLALTMSCACVNFVNTNNYYKSYGQLLIHDDLFLTTVGDVLLGLKFGVALLWGAFIDKYGVKSGLVGYLACVSLSNIFFYFSPMLNKWIYAIAAIFLAGVSTPLNTLYSICVAKTFGKRNCTSNFGLVSVFCVVVYLVLPFALEAILQQFGWFYVFFLAASLAALALIVLILGLDE